MAQSVERYKDDHYCDYCGYTEFEIVESRNWQKCTENYLVDLFSFVFKQRIYKYQA